ncbi:penicillin acylase family protein [Variovorax sp. UC74_104]|uniref:penicillin acylase family protein n=1 Tax=Variovorax sp. UC74_104 TaxID=3374555 RepID=UPI00375718B3
MNSRDLRSSPSTFARPSESRRAWRLGLCVSTAAALAACGGSNSGGSNFGIGIGNGVGSSSGPGVQESAAPGNSYKAGIRRTAHGIPHIEADDEKGIGYGVGYAYAQDNFCVLAEHLVTVRGERSRYFGEGALPASGQGTLPANVSSDLFYRQHNDDASLRTAWSAYSEPVKAMFKGFAAGYNRYLRETGAAGLPESCNNKTWVRAVEEADLVRLMRDYAALNGLADTAPFLAQASPPGRAGSAAKTAPQPSEQASQTALLAMVGKPSTGSNAMALGSDATANGQGLVLGNPHFPWAGVLRLYQLHLTIPGRMDVMGASLPGLPIVGIGFTRDFAWTHTTNTAARLTLHQLRLDPADPTRYMVDGKSKAMERKVSKVDVLESDGRIAAREHAYYATDFGTVIALGPLRWDSQYAYTVRDANTDNHRLADQWLAMNQARSLDELKDSVLRIVGNPWNNTLAADAGGRTLFMSATPTPNISEAMLAGCEVAGANVDPEALKSLPAPLLRGDTARCQWANDPAAPQAGIFAGKLLPLLERHDYVQNSNDSAWLTNPQAPLEGFSPLVSIAGSQQGLRTRQGLAWLQATLQPRNGLPTRRVSQDQVEAMVLDNRVYLAELVLADMLSLCPGESGSPQASADLKQACSALQAWDRTAGLDAGIGYGYLEDFALSFLRQTPGAWRVAFDPADPVNTPRGLRVEQPEVAAQVREAMEAAVRNVAAKGWAPSQRWGDIQGATRGARRIPVPGGDDELGVYNMMISVDTKGNGLREAVHGTSYLQSVGFTAQGPRAKAFLAYSQSTNPDSAWFADQTERFARREWVELPFTRAQIDAQTDTALKVIAE